MIDIYTHFKLKNDETKVALVTGASGGLGAEYVHQLAAKGWNLLIIARRFDLLNKLADEMRDKHGVKVEVFPADLSKPDGMNKAANRAVELENLDLLINNAGFGTWGRFEQVEWQKSLDMINLQVTAPARLIHAALPGMLKRNRGQIINISSVAAFFAGSGNVMYSATKACLKSISLSLAMELENTGVQVQCLCPGYTVTGFHDTSEYQGFNRSTIPDEWWMSAEEVVRISLDSLNDREHVVVIPGRGNREFVKSTLCQMYGEEGGLKKFIREQEE